MKMNPFSGIGPITMENSIVYRFTQSNEHIGFQLYAETEFTFEFFDKYLN
jgi:hypothetical protein